MQLYFVSTETGQKREVRIALVGKKQSHKLWVELLKDLKVKLAKNDLIYIYIYM